MKNIRFHSIVTVLVMLAGVLSIFPRDENLRLGKDRVHFCGKRGQDEDAAGRLATV